MKYWTEETTANKNYRSIAVKQINKNAPFMRLCNESPPTFIQ